MTKTDGQSLRIKAVLFDVDGTLFSSEGIIHQVYGDEFSRMKEERGRPAVLPTLPEIMQQIGKPVVTIFSNLAPDLTDEERSLLSNRVLDNLVKRIGAGEGEHYPKVTETLRAIRGAGYKIFAASNGRFRYVEAILKANETISCFDEIPVLDNVRIKNKVELVQDTLVRHSIAAGQAVVVGDRAADRDAALSNNVRFVGCTYGHGSADELLGAAALIDEIARLPDALESLSIGAL
ncbi:MAG: HAD family hydrolase [Spirochaetia bacterium]|nr:HAD family hydrolase [Spirochaetia bacterium]